MEVALTGSGKFALDTCGIVSGGSSFWALYAFGPEIELWLLHEENVEDVELAVITDGSEIECGLLLEIFDAEVSDGEEMVRAGLGMGLLRG